MGTGEEGEERGVSEGEGWEGNEVAGEGGSRGRQDGKRGSMA